MTEKDLFLQRMEKEFLVTVKVLKAVPQDRGDFTPHERSQSITRIVQTLIAEINGMVRAINGEEQVFSPIETASLEEAISLYEKSYEDAMQILRSISEETFERDTVGMFANFFPRRMDVLWMFLYDSIHHRGQLSVYIRLAGGQVPSIYGPSADDNPFAQSM